MKLKVVAALLAATAAFAQIRLVQYPSKSPLVSFRIVFTAGSAADPPEKPGLAALTAYLIADGGTKNLTYQQVQDALFPMAGSLSVQVDKEMTAFAGVTHTDTLADYYKLLRERLIEPGFREDDFTRVRQDLINSIQSGLRNNDEELGKEVLFETIFQGTPYQHYSLGTVDSLEKLTLEDVRNFYQAQYCQTNLFLGIAGGFSNAFLQQMKKDFHALPQGAGFRPREKKAPVLDGVKAVIVEKETRSVAISLGFPILTTRQILDYPALLVANAYFGQHRVSYGELYQQMREARGLNYGDYSYIEYFPNAGYRMEPPPDVARRQQIFQMWVRPVEPPNARFAVRMAVYELDKLIRDGIPEDGFERARDFVSRYVNFLTRTANAQIGYGIDSIWYNTPPYAEYVRTAIAKLTREQVNQAIRRNLQTNRMVITIVANHAADLKAQLASDDPSPISYNSPKPEAVTAEDKTIEKYPLHLKPEDIAIVPASSVPLTQ
jgi:zinc protease